MARYAAYFIVRKSDAVTQSEKEPEDPIFTKKQLVLLIFPLLVEQLLAITIGLSDTIMVAGAGEAAVSGVSVVDAINVLLIQIFTAMATGGAVVAAQYIGSGNRQGACDSAKQLMYVTAIIALLLMALCLCFLRQILHIVYGDLSADVMGNAVEYFRYTAISYPFLAIYSAGAALFRAMGNSRISMFVSLMDNIVNIGLNVLFVYNWGWGAKGSGIATLYARVVAAAVMGVLICRAGNLIRIERPLHYVPDFPMIGRILHIGVPNGLESSMFQIGKLIVQRQVTALGTSAIAANAVAGTVTNIANIPANAIGLALITIVGQCVGAGDCDAAVHFTKRLMAVTYATVGAVCALLFVFAGPIIGIYRLSPAAASPAILLTRTFYVADTPLAFPAFTLTNALRAAGDVRFTMIASTLSMWVFRIGFSFILLGLGMQVLGVWCAMYIDWLVRSVIFILRFRSGKWKTKKVI